MSIWQFLYKDNAHVPLIRRLTGLLLILISPYGASYFTRAEPYMVPAWLISSSPELPVWVFLMLWLICMLSGLALALGKSSKVLIALPAILIAFCGTVEFTSIYCNYYVLLWLYLMALLLYEEPRSMTRTVMQLALSSCYFFSALEKLRPEWISGNSLYQVFSQGWCLRPEFMFLTNIKITKEFACAAALTVIALELYLAFAFFFRKTRASAFVLGLALHLSFSIVFSGIDLFTPIVFLGYLAFLNKRVASKPLNSVPRLQKLIPGLVLILFMLLMPVRFYLSMDSSKFPLLTFCDLSPWGFAMFLEQEEIAWISVSFTDSKNNKHEIELKSSRLNLGGTRELETLCRYLMQKHPEAVKAEVISIMTINRHRMLEKRCTARRISGQEELDLSSSSRFLN